MTVAVRPDVLVATSAYVAAEHATLAGITHLATFATSPIPAGTDSVSAMASAAFSGFSGAFTATTVDGLVKMSSGSGVLPIIAAEYAATDMLSAANIAASGIV